MGYIKSMPLLIEMAAKEADEMELEDIVKIEILPLQSGKVIIVLHDEYATEWYIHFAIVDGKWIVEMNICLPLYQHELA